MDLLLEQSMKDVVDAHSKDGGVITVCKECSELGVVPITEAFAKEARKRLSVKFGVDLTKPNADGVYESCSLTFQKCTEHAFLFLGDKIP